MARKKKMSNLVGLQCLNCHMGHMQMPESGHSSYVVCDNCGCIELTYTPQDYQRGMHKVDYTQDTEGDIEAQIIGVFGGYGSGKSRASLTEFLLRALENPGGTGLFTAPTLQQLKRTTLKTWFKEVCPPVLIKSYNKTEGEIVLLNGFTIYTIPSDDEEKLRSINAGLVHMEEASGIKRTIYDQLLTRMRDPFVKNRAFLVCSNPDLGWIREVFYLNMLRKDPKHPEHDQYNPFIHTFIWETKLNKHLPKDFIALNSAGKPQWWIKRFLEGSFDHSEGMVYPNVMKCFRFSDEVISKDPKIADEFGIPKDWERFVTMDHGITNPTAVYFNAIDPNQGRVVTYYEYYQAGKTVPEHAKVLKPLIEKIPHGRLRFMVADPSIRNKSDPVDGKSVQYLYQEYGLYFTPGNNNWEAGILKVNSYIERGKWIILQDRCPNLCRELVNYKYKEVTMDDANENRDERPVKANDHGCDSTRYGFMRLPDDPDNLKTLAFEPNRRYNQGRKGENEWHFDPDSDEYEAVSGGDWTSYV